MRLCFVHSRCPSSKISSAKVRCDLSLHGHVAKNPTDWPYRWILRYYRCDTAHRAIPFTQDQDPPKLCKTLPCHLVSHRHICDARYLHFATYRDSCAIPSRRYRKSIAAGPLSLHTHADRGYSIGLLLWWEMLSVFQKSCPA